MTKLLPASSIALGFCRSQMRAKATVRLPKSYTGTATVQRTRQRFVEDNVEGALNERPRLGGQKKLDEKGEAILETLAQSKPPAGRKRWTLQLLADRLVELKVVDSISYETVRQEVKKSGLRLK
jgi:hypothetical protein